MEGLLPYIHRKPWNTLKLVAGAFGESTADSLVYAVFWELRRNAVNVTLDETRCALSDPECWRTFSDKLREMVAAAIC